MGLYQSTAARVNDSSTETLKKILQVMIDGGVAMPLYTDDNPNVNDSSEVTLKKILDVLNGAGGIGGTQVIYEGHGAPGALVPEDPTKPALYSNLDFPFELFKWSSEAQAWN